MVSCASNIESEAVAVVSVWLESTVGMASVGTSLRCLQPPIRRTVPVAMKKSV